MWLSPKPLPMERGGKRLQASPPLAPNPLLCHSLSACPSAAAAVSHLTFSSPLSRAGSCSPSHGSATARQGKDTGDASSLARLPTCTQGTALFGEMLEITHLWQVTAGAHTHDRGKRRQQPSRYNQSGRRKAEVCKNLGCKEKWVKCA